MRSKATKGTRTCTHQVFVLSILGFGFLNSTALFWLLHSRIAIDGHPDQSRPQRATPLRVPSRAGGYKHLARTGGGRKKKEQTRPPLHIISRNQPIPPDPPRIAILRSVGNALPPRHDSTQAVRSLQFTLQHEPSPPSVRKHWLLNRIVDKTVLDKLVALLEKHGQNYTIEAFNFTTYGKIRYISPVRLGSTEDKYHKYGYPYEDGSLWPSNPNFPGNRRKRIYATNLNSARNMMIDIALHKMEPFHPDWILPLDGNCFFTEDGLHDLIVHLHTISKGVKGVSDRYASIPMYRHRGANSDLLKLEHNITQADAAEEPQLAFRRDSMARFHPGLWYGKANKIELLNRLRIMDVINNPVYLKWVPLQKYVDGPPVHAPVPDLPDDVRVSDASWVARLQSGKVSLEKNITSRGETRELSVTRLLDRIDKRVLTEGFNFTTQMLMFYDYNVLQHEKSLFKQRDERLMSLIEVLTTKSDEIIASRANLTRSKTIQSNETACREIRESQDNITILSLAYFMTDKEDYGQHAGVLVHRWFSEESAPLIPQKEDWPCPLESMNGLPHMLDGVRLLHRGGAFNKTLIARWMDRYYRWLDRSLIGQRYVVAKNRTGTLFDVQTVALGAFTNRTHVTRWYLEHAHSRLGTQARKDNNFEESAKGHNCEDKKRLALQPWHTLSRIAEKVGINLWDQLTITGERVLCAVSHRPNPYFRIRDECEDNGVPMDGKRWWPLSFTPRHQCPLLVDLEVVENDWLINADKPPPQDIYEMPPLYDLSTEIAPFWNLGFGGHKG